MTILQPSRAILATALVGLLGACSGSLSPSPQGPMLGSSAASTNSRADRHSVRGVRPVAAAAGPAASAPRVGTASGNCSGAVTLIGDLDANVVNVYNQGGTGQTPCLQITQGMAVPWGLAVRGKTLYVGNENTGQVNAYTYPFNGAPKLVCTVPAYQVPYGMALDRLGNLYAGNFPANAITKCTPKGATKQLTDANLQTIYFVAVDITGDLFVDGNTSNGSIILDESTDHGKTWNTIQTGYQFPGGIALDQNQNLYVSDQGNGANGTIWEYAPPYTGAAISSFTYSGDVPGLALKRLGKRLWAANSAAKDGVAFALPGGKVVSTTATQGYTLDIAVYPAGRI